MIRFDHVSKTYPGGTRAVEDFSLTVERGSTTVLLGTSGCGKTTLMRMVNAMVTPTSGAVFVRGANVADEDPVRLRRSIGYVLQEGGLFPHRTIADNIATVPRLEGAGKKESRERALSSWSWWAWTRRWQIVTPPSCRAGSVSARGSRGRWRTARTSC